MKSCVARCCRKLCGDVLSCSPTACAVSFTTIQTARLDTGGSAFSAVGDEASRNVFAVPAVVVLVTAELGLTALGKALTLCI